MSTKKKKRSRSSRSLPQLARTGLSWLTGIGWRGIENPDVPLDSQAIEGWLGRGGMTDAGVEVSERTALNFAAVKTCTAILAESVGVLPLGVVERLPSGGRKRAEGHPIDPIVHESPNPEQTASVAKEAMQARLGLTGAGFARIVRDGFGEVRELWPLCEPHQVTIARRKADRQLRYVVRDDGRPSTASQTGRAGGGELVLHPMEVLHVPGFGDGINGLSPVGLMRQAIGLGLGLEQFAGKALSQGAWMSFVVEHPEVLEDETFERLDREFKGKGGLADAWAPTILEDGMKLNQLGMPSEDALFLSVRKYQLREVARWYRIPPHMLADLEGGASFASIEQMSLEFVLYTLGIWLAKWEQELTRKLLGADRGRYFIRFNADAFMRGATKDRYEAFKIATGGASWLTVNEVRALEHRPPVEGGERLIQPLNMAPLGSTPTAEPASSGTTGGSSAELEASRRQGRITLLAEAADRVARFEYDRITKSAELDVDAFEAWAGDFWQRQREAIEANLRATVLGVGLIDRPGVSGDELVEAAQRAISAYCDESAADAIRARAGDGIEALLGGYVEAKRSELAERVERAIMGESPTKGA